MLIVEGKNLNDISRLFDSFPNLTDFLILNSNLSKEQKKFLKETVETNKILEKSEMKNKLQKLLESEESIDDSEDQTHDRE